MFNTFKYDPETRQVQQLRSAFDPVTARSNQHQACNNCHAKKLRCSGEKSGCERCIAGSLVCEYTRSTSRSSRSSRRAGSGSRPKKPYSSSSASSDGAPAGDTSPSSGPQSRILTPSPPPAAPQHLDNTITAATTTPRPRPLPPAVGTAHGAFLGAAFGLDMHAFPADISQGAVGAMPAVGFAAGEAIGGYPAFSPHEEHMLWQPSAEMAALAADPSFLGGFVAEPGATPDQFFAMFPDLTQFPPDQDPQSRYWSGEQ
ncbi:Arabinolytic transcriptional activator araR [Escovopsis weberi]|uniref:Arabinolytic transcriptional activator araR n=1 Tax=Escovopsis weberi TaxID=150374 RepID=A0A0M8MSS3_ESCWE|nr:Arabinolytic transcriptional activator araR [Escovopsis weberi]